MSGRWGRLLIGREPGRSNEAVTSPLKHLPPPLVVIAQAVAQAFRVCLNPLPSLEPANSSERCALNLGVKGGRSEKARCEAFGCRSSSIERNDLERHSLSRLEVRFFFVSAVSDLRGYHQFSFVSVNVCSQYSDRDCRFLSA